MTSSFRDRRIQPAISQESQPEEPVQTGDGTDTLFSPTYGQTYHSKHGALTESRHVFVNGAGVSERLARGLPTRVLEIGFGTGLNFLLTAHLADEAQTPLHYVALEQDLLPVDVLGRLNHGSRLGAVALRNALLAWRDTLPDSVPPGRYVFDPGGFVSLELLIGNATETNLPADFFDAVYLDAFSPEANPELWTTFFFGRLYRSLREGALLATYSVKGTVRRGLAAVGFHVEKRPGPPGGKREMLVATR